jgi:hypothetical protein
MEITMNGFISPKRMLGAGFAAAIALSAIGQATAAPVLSNTAAFKATAADHVTEVRWRAGPAIAAGAIAGLALGAAAASSSPYYGPGYGYYEPGYYAPPPVVYYPSYGPYHRYAPGYDSRGYFNGRVDTNAGGTW